MTNIYQLLKFRFNPEHYRELGEDLVSTKTQKKLSDSIIKLKAIGIEQEDISGLPPEDLETTYGLFTQTFKQDPSMLYQLFYSRSRKRMLSYAIGFRPVRDVAIVDQPEALKIALDVLRQNWLPEITKGLVDVIL